MGQQIRYCRWEKDEVLVPFDRGIHLTGAAAHLFLFSGAGMDPKEGVEGGMVSACRSEPRKKAIMRRPRYRLLKVLVRNLVSGAVTLSAIFLVFVQCGILQGRGQGCSFQQKARRGESFQQ